MSLCRFWWEGSDLYIYESDRGIECCGCRLDEWATFDEEDTEAIVAHLTRHVAAGHVVQPYVFAEFGAEHPNPGPALEARDAWRAEHPKYAWMWSDEPLKALEKQIERGDFSK